MAEPVGVLLLNLGGPDSLGAVEPFLVKLFSDPDILSFPLARLIRRPLARFIARRRAPKVRGYYSDIGGRSPIRELTEAQARALELELGPPYRCYVAMRYWMPTTEDALGSARRDGVRRFVALPLYPQYSKATTGSSLAVLRAALRPEERLTVIEAYPEHPMYLDALADKLNAALEFFAPEHPPQVLFSAHSLPQKLIDEGDPYLDQIKTTVQGVLDRLASNGRVIDWHLTFQSKVGPIRWLEPATDATIVELAARGHRSLLLVPIAFVSDHIETLQEIDMRYRDLAFAHGVTEFRRAESLNSTPRFIQALGDLVRQHVEGRRRVERAPIGVDT